MPLSLSSGKLYISHDVLFMENIFPYKESSTADNSATQLTIGLLGSSPTHTHQAISSIDSSPAIPMSSGVISEHQSTSQTSEHLSTSVEPNITSPITTSPEPHDTSLTIGTSQSHILLTVIYQLKILLNSQL